MILSRKRVSSSSSSSSSLSKRQCVQQQQQRYGTCSDSSSSSSSPLIFHPPTTPQHHPLYVPCVVWGLVMPWLSSNERVLLQRVCRTAKSAFESPLYQSCTKTQHFLPYRNVNDDVEKTRRLFFVKNFLKTIYFKEKFEQVYKINTNITPTPRTISRNFPIHIVPRTHHIVIWLTPGFNWSRADEWINSLSTLPHLRILSLVNASRCTRNITPLKNVRWNQFKQLEILHLSLFSTTPYVLSDMQKLPLSPVTKTIALSLVGYDVGTFETMHPTPQRHYSIEAIN